MSITACIVGASGYTGGELLRLLLSHPEVEVREITSEKSKGVRATRVHPNLRGFTELEFTSAAEVKYDSDVVFLATPHGASFDLVKKFVDAGVKVIDLSADFRLHDATAYPVWYGYAHKYPALLERAVYGLPELHRKEIANAELVACPGCLSTSAILALAPLVASGFVDLQHVVIDSKIGSSAGGHSPDASTHHPERAGVVRAYKPTGHRHTAEIEQELSALAGVGKVSVGFSPHAVEMVRGILTTAHAYLAKEAVDLDVWKAYRAFYSGSPFVRLVKEKSGVYRYPEPKMVMGTNFCDIGFEVDAHVPRIVVMSAIDNLVKGSAGQAVQCMNLMFGFDEKAGLWIPGHHP